MQPHVFEALVKQWQRRERRKDRRAMEMVAAIINKPVSGYKMGEPVRAEQLMGPDPDAEDNGNPDGLPTLTQFVQSLKKADEMKAAAKSSANV